MSRVGLVLGGGGITGAAFHFGALLSLRMATGWNPRDAAAIVGTSSGAVLAALTRSDRLSLEALVGDVHGDAELTEELARRIYRRTPAAGMARWMRHGLLPGLRRPGIGLTLGSPARFSTAGIAEWVRDTIGPDADHWPQLPTTIVAYQVEGRRRVAFGTEGSPDVDIATAVAASAAVPLVFQPVVIEGRHYVDGGVASGTSVDLLLGLSEPLDLVIVSAPMAALEARPDSRFYVEYVDRLGAAALDRELQLLAAAWPGTDVVVLRPDATVLAASSPNPLDPAAALPAFLATLASMRDVLSGPEVWPILARHFPRSRGLRTWARRLRVGKG